ncbi:MAG: hypothetical protein ACYDIC_11725 [Desulfobaccales bacterium]
MSMDPELWLQQCRIYQNKDKEAITIPFIDDDNFYKALDKYVFGGYKLRIDFLNSKLAQGSVLIERILSCLNGRLLIDDSKNINDNLRNILAFTSQETFIKAIMNCINANIKIYNTYLFKYNGNDTLDKKSILCLEPAGEGLPSQSFTVDI